MYLTGLAVLSPACVLDLPPLLDDDGTTNVPPTGPGMSDGPPGGAGGSQGMDPGPPGDGGPGGNDGSGGAGPDPASGGTAGTDQRPDAGGGTANGTTGGSVGDGGGIDGSSGSDGEGGDGGDDPPMSCSSAERECDGNCIDASQSCCPGGCELDNATAECVDDECVITGCNEGHFDCDGSAANGCEGPPDFVPLMGSRVIAGRVDVSQAGDPFEGRPLHPLLQPCTECGQEDVRVPLPPPVNAGSVAPTEVQAGFALGWDEDALYLRAEVFDDDVPVPGADVQARHYDNIEFLFDGVPDTQDGPDDRLIFLGFDGDYSEMNNRNEDDTVSFLGQSVYSNSCYVITAKFTREFLSQEEPGIELTLGGVLHFNVAVNDWDTPPPPDPDDPDPPPEPDPAKPYEHKAHLFHRDPGTNYWFGVRTLPELELGE